MFGNAPKALWSHWCPSDDRGRIELACRSLFVEWGSKKILCETGIGNFFDPKLSDRFGVTESEHLLLKNLAAMGVEEGAIDYVILSHLHFDHAGGLLPAFGSTERRLLFPKARYIVGEEAWSRALKPHPRDRASFVPELQSLLQASGRLDILRRGDVHPDLKDIVDFIWSDGHTPGQMLTRLRGSSNDVIFCGDLIPGEAWVKPAITMGYDRFAEKVIDEKKELYEHTDLSRSVFFFTHDSRIAAATLKPDEKSTVVVDKRWEKLSHHPI